MGTHLQYGGIKLRNVLTKLFHEEPVRTEDGVDTKYWKYIVSVQSIVTRNCLNKLTANNIRSTMGPANLVKDTAAENFSDVIAYLKRDRLSFQYSIDTLVDINGATEEKIILKSVPANTEADKIGDYDANNGPHPIDCDIVHVTGEVFRITYTIEICKSCENLKSAKGSGLVASNRWSVADDVDESQLLTRVWTGVLRLRVPFDGKNERTAHEFRNLCLPTLTSDFRRISMKFAGSSDNMELRYTVTDRQAAGAFLPDPLVSITGTHVESASMDGTSGGIVSIGQIQIKCVGKPGAVKAEMIALAISAAKAKLDITQKGVATVQIPSVAVIDHIQPDRPIIEVSMTVVRNATANTESVSTDMAIDISKITNELQMQIRGQNTHARSVPNPTGTVAKSVNNGMMALAAEMYCYLQSPCDLEHGIAQSQSSGLSDANGKNPSKPIFTDSGAKPDSTNNTQSNPPPTASYSTYRADDPPPYSFESKEHQTNPWTIFQATWIYNNDSGIVALPIADSGSSSKSQSAFVAIQLARSNTLVRYMLTAERLGLWPTLPSGQDIQLGDATYGYLSDKVLANNARISVDGQTYIFSMSAEYNYYLKSEVSQVTIPRTPLQLETPGLSEILSAQAAQQFFDNKGQTKAAKTDSQQSNAQNALKQNPPA